MAAAIYAQTAHRASGRGTMGAAVYPEARGGPPRASPEPAGKLPIAAAADDYLRLFGVTALAFAWGGILAALARRPELAALDPESSRYPALARHYVEKILPETGALFARIAAGKASLAAEALPA